jgi:hypothetical protein
MEEGKRYMKIEGRLLEMWKRKRRRRGTDEKG